MNSSKYLLALAAVLLLWSCGGGGGGGGPVISINEIMDPRPHLTQWRNNPPAEDLLDHWNDAEVAEEALGLSAVSPADMADRKTTVKALLEVAEGDPANSGIRFRDVRLEDIEIIGERDGITYAQWKGGPAGTLNIEFDWRFAPNLDPMVRAELERAGKSWSRRLLDDFGTHVIEKGTTIRTQGSHAGAELFTGTFDEPVTTDGILVAVIHATTDPASSAGPRAAEITEDDYEPWFGAVILSQQNLDSRSNYWPIHVMAHELGHIVGIGNHERRGNVPSYERYVNRQDYTFDGPRTRAANGGEGVPFQWLDENRHEVPPHTPNATVDYAHLGVCSSLLAYCNDPREIYEPSEIDFAFLADIGYELLDAETASDLELYGYGAWGRYSAWGVGVERMLGYEDRGSDVFPVDRLRAGADAFGIAPSMSLGELHSAGPQGRLTWTGSLLGVDLGSTKLPPVFGGAELGVDIATLDGTARFDNLTVHTDGEASAFRAPNLEYSIQVTDNSFSDTDGRVEGGFFGPAHEEMAGVLDDQAPEVNLLAGFGGTR